MNQITALESTRNGNRSESERKIQAKDEVISRLEQQVFSQEQLLGSMRIELEQLRGSMSKANISRRDEVDEMQEELLDKAAKLKQKEREISALKMKLDEEKLQHTDEIAKLKTQLASRGADSATIKGSREIREGQEIVELKETIQQLRRRNTALSEENSKLCSRIDNLETDKKNMGSSDKWRTSALKDKVKTLMLRVQELEGRHKELRSSATYEWGTGSP
jgi:chromosome segregation ATPase